VEILEKLQQKYGQQKCVGGLHDLGQTKSYVTLKSHGSQEGGKLSAIKSQKFDNTFQFFYDTRTNKLFFEYLSILPTNKIVTIVLKKIC
jgi:hypothetical protein